jgi:hypothetical protein
MIRERLDGENIKGAFFVWTTGLAPVQWGDPPPAAQADPTPDAASSFDAGPVANVVGSEASPNLALTAATAPAIVNTAPPAADNQPAISCGVLELVKFTLELE